jgi:hypothetical protein
VDARDKRGHDEVAHGICVVMRGRNRPKYGVLSQAYDPRMTPMF